MKKQLKIVGKHVLLALLAFLWLIPIVWLLVTSFSAYKGYQHNAFFPTEMVFGQLCTVIFSTGYRCKFPGLVSEFYDYRSGYLCDIYSVCANGCVCNELYAFSCA